MCTVKLPFAVVLVWPITCGVLVPCVCSRMSSVAAVMTAAEVAALLRAPRSTVEHWARMGIVPSRKVGRRRIYVRSRIEALLLEDDADAPEQP